MMNPFPLDKLTVDSILQGAVYVRFCGLIKYLDFFDRQRETAFHFRWNAPNISMNALRSYAFPEGWVEVGGDKENYCT